MVEVERHDEGYFLSFWSYKIVKNVFARDARARERTEAEEGGEERRRGRGTDKEDAAEDESEQLAAPRPRPHRPSRNYFARSLLQIPPVAVLVSPSYHNRHSRVLRPVRVPEIPLALSVAKHLQHSIMITKLRLFIIGYGVTANIAASHAVRGSSGFDSPYPNSHGSSRIFAIQHKLPVFASTVSHQISSIQQFRRTRTTRKHVHP